MCLCFVCNNLRDVVFVCFVFVRVRVLNMCVLFVIHCVVLCVFECARAFVVFVCVNEIVCFICNLFCEMYNMCLMVV